MHIDLAGQVVGLAELRARPERYRGRFAQARRSPGYARCLCTRTGQRLVIRELAGRFHLARWPDTADDHVPACPFFAISTASRYSSAGAHRDAITITEHGVRIAVDLAFTSDVADPNQPKDQPGDQLDSQVDDGDPLPVAALLDGARAQASTVTVLGLLQWLWEAAGLTTWPGAAAGSNEVPARPSEQVRPAATPPPRRRWDECSAALTVTTAGLRLGDEPAAQRLHVVAPYRPARPGDQDPQAAASRVRDARLAAFLRPLEHPETVTIRGGPRRGRTRHIRHRRLLLGELKDLTKTRQGHKLALRHFPRPLFLTTEQHTHLTQTYSAAFSERRGPRARRVVLALVEGTPHGYLRLVDAAVLLTSSDYVPAESSHEVAMAEQLVAAGRAFMKPLRYGGGAVHPDFVLTDTDPATIVEVWGVTGRADYEARKADKQALYRESGASVLEWSVRDPMPAIPAAPPPDRT